jgi:pimeloyl-ACP methyl ester carboxylesterase
MNPVHAPQYGPAGRSPWLDVDWRLHRRWIVVQGRAVNLVEMGSGPAVVFVHGLSGGWQNWLEQIPVIAAAGYRCIAMDLPGFGDSPMPAEKISIAGYARFLDALLGRLEVDAACVVGNSMGGYVAAELAIAAPQRVERLVLVAAAGITSQELRNERLLAGLKRAEWLLGLYGSFFAARSQFVASHERLRRRALLLITAHPELLPGPLVGENLRGSGKPGFIDALDALTNYPIKDRLQQIACPTLVVWGAKDYLVPVRDADVFESLIPDARKVVFADTGHVPQLERPDAVNQLLLEFLAEAPGEEVGPEEADPAADGSAEAGLAEAATARARRTAVAEARRAAGDGAAADGAAGDGLAGDGVAGDGVAGDGAAAAAAAARTS